MSPAQSYRYYTTMGYAPPKKGDYTSWQATGVPLPLDLRWETPVEEDAPGRLSQALAGGIGGRRSSLRFEALGHGGSGNFTTPGAVPAETLTLGAAIFTSSERSGAQRGDRGGAGCGGST